MPPRIFGALGQESRLRVLRLLLAQRDERLAGAATADRLSLPASTLPFI